MIESLIAAAGGPVQTLANTAATLWINQQSQNWQEKMYNRQYLDNIALWKMQNEYNSPSAQRERLKQANLNPALMYGGSGGGGVAASQPQSAKAGNPAFNVPKMDALQQYYGLKTLAAKASQEESLAEREKMITDAWRNIESLETDVLDPVTGEPTGIKTKLSTKIIGEWNQVIGAGISSLNDAQFSGMKNEQEYYKLLEEINLIRKKMWEIEETQGRNDLYYKLAKTLGYLGVAINGVKMGIPFLKSITK